MLSGRQSTPRLARSLAQSLTPVPVNGYRRSGSRCLYPGSLSEVSARKPYYLTTPIFYPNSGSSRLHCCVSDLLLPHCLRKIAYDGVVTFRLEFYAPKHLISNRLRLF